MGAIGRESTMVEIARKELARAAKEGDLNSVRQLFGPSDLESNKFDLSP